MGIQHWLLVVLVIVLLFGGSKVSNLMGDVAKGIKAFKKGLQEDDKPAEQPEVAKSIEHNSAPPTASHSDVGSKAV